MISKGSDQSGLVNAQADLSVCLSHIPHCWKSHVAAHMAMIFSRQKKRQNMRNPSLITSNSTFIRHNMRKSICISTYHISLKVCLLVLMLYIPVNDFSVMLGRFPVFLVSLVEPVLSRG